MYKVIKFFTDLQDNKYPYEVGSTYPRKGLSVTEERIAELSGSNNRQKTALIEEVSEPEKEEPIKEVQEPKENVRESKEKVQEPKAQNQKKKTNKKKDK